MKDLFDEIEDQLNDEDIIIPEENTPDIDDIPAEIRNKLHFIPVSNMDTVLQNALR